MLEYTSSRNLNDSVDSPRQEVLVQSVFRASSGTVKRRLFTSALEC